MVKVFLAEDEFIVREGIKKNIDWASAGYDFCGEASDGELALPMIRKLSPDIVITDIKMPFMDGLELSRLIRKEFPWIEIIILSGYEEFEYAKEGIKIGVAQYLTKPITSEELLAEVDNVARKIIKRKEEEELRLQFEKEMAENDKKSQKELFHNIVSGAYSTTEILSMAEEVDVDLSAMWYSVALIYSKSENHEPDEYSNSAVAISDRINEVVTQNNCLLFDRNLEGEAIIFKADSEEELKEQQDKVLGIIEGIFEEYPQVRYFGGIGYPVNRLSLVQASFEAASYAMAHRYFISENRFMSGDNLQEGSNSGDDNLNIKEIDAKRIDRRNLVKFFKTGSLDEIPFFLNEFIKSAGENAFKSALFRQYIAMDTYFCAVTFVEELGKNRVEIEVPEVGQEIMSTSGATLDYMRDVFERVIGIRESIANNRYSEIVEEAVKFIEENYSDEELSLNALASHVNVSPNHLSTIFSQQTGQTFIKYLTEYRMEKAKELLKCTGKRSSEISEEVGYKDPHYFSYMFKKSVGMTPTKYRGGKDAEEED